MAFCGKKNEPFTQVTPSGMKINYALGKVTTKRAGLKFIREGSGVQINIINKDKIDVQKLVVGLMPNFIHSLDATNIHELTDSIHKLKINEINKEIEEVIIRNGYNITYKDILEDVKPYLINKYTSRSSYNLPKDNTIFDSELVKKNDLIKICAFNQNIPLYTIHDCFATTPNHMEFIKSKVISLCFSTLICISLHLSQKHYILVF